MVKIGYLSATEVETSLFLGAAMVTDAFGLPVEFRYTEPVRASALQRVLYGSSLQRYLCREVIAETLLASLEHLPEVWIVREDLLLEPLPKMRAPVVMLEPTEMAPLTDLGATLPSGESEMLVQLSLAGAPLRVRFGNREAEARQSALDALKTAAVTMDLLEPLHRLQQAIRLVQEEPDAA